VIFFCVDQLPSEVPGSDLTRVCTLASCPHLAAVPRADNLSLSLPDWVMAPSPRSCECHPPPPGAPFPRSQFLPSEVPPIPFVPVPLFPPASTRVDFLLGATRFPLFFLEPVAILIAPPPGPSFSFHPTFFFPPSASSDNCFKRRPFFLIFLTPLPVAFRLRSSPGSLCLFHIFGAPRPLPGEGSLVVYF